MDRILSWDNLRKQLIITGSVIVLALLSGFHMFATAASCSAQSFKKGSSGSCVVTLQQRLNTYSCTPGPNDGIFGSQTDAAARRFQTANGLVVDGIVGPQTWGKLMAGNSKYCSTSSSTTSRSVPANSGSGRRIVVSQAQNWVWIIDSSGRVVASGGMIDNPAYLAKDTYFVSERKVVNYDNGGQWRLNNFIRFKGGVGFHQIPINSSTGTRMHSESILGTNQAKSHGCIRVSVALSSQLWNFAGIGTKVVVI